VKICVQKKKFIFEKRYPNLLVFYKQELIVMPISCYLITVAQCKNNVLYFYLSVLNSYVSYHEGKIFFAHVTNEEIKL